MANKEKLKKIMDGLSYPESGVKEVFKLAEKEMQKVASKLRDDAEVKTVEMAKKKIAEVKDQVQSIFEYLDILKGDLQKSEGDLMGALNQNLDDLRSKMAEYRTASLDRLGTLSAEMDGLKDDIKEISQRKVEIPNYEGQIGEIESKLGDLILGLKEETSGKVESILIDSKKTTSDLEKMVSALEVEIKKLRTDTMSVIASRGGGNMNRNILVGSNPSTLGRYGDLNIKAGANITLTYLNNDNLKTTDLTVAATGGGGGTSRNISTVSVSSVVAATPSTDIVIIAGAGVQLTMPTAVGNTNLYTIKNTSTSSILLTPNGSEKIDTAANLILNVQYTSVDLISDNANWQIT